MPEFRKWPGDTDYIDAVQAPDVCFEDPRWRSAVFEKDDFEIPVAATGRSAIVFQAKVNSDDVALRCFTRSTGSQKGRYEKLNAHLKQLSPPACFVGFSYHDKAILVNGMRYPMVEMTWSQGIPLNEWIDSHQKRSGDLAGLAATWQGVINDLWTRQIAHGDLANDNCLVNGSNIDLVDYDSCYIPVLAREDPGEAGNIHFQHPMRDGYYGLNMDAFPALVIYLSVLATAEASVVEEPVTVNQAPQPSEQGANWWVHWSPEWQEPRQPAQVDPTSKSPVPKPTPPVLPHPKPTSAPRWGTAVAVSLMLLVALIALIATVLTLHHHP